MDIDELRNEYQRLTRLNTIGDSLDLLDRTIEYLFNVISNHPQSQFHSRADIDANLINQMLFTKISHLKPILQGFEYVAKDGTKLNRIIDPTVVATLVRGIFETVAMFNLIYVRTQDSDEKLILYNLWVHAGLKFRQRFEEVITTDENRTKFEKETERLSILKNEIENTDLYKSLDSKNKNKIQTKLKKKDYKIQFNDKQVEDLSWQDLVKVIGVREGLMDKVYTYFSLYAHPSNVAVFQFDAMFKPSEHNFIHIANHNLKYCFFFISIFIADFITAFPQVLESYNRLPKIDQMVINGHNMLVRSREYSINDTWKELG